MKYRFDKWLDRHRRWYGKHLLGIEISIICTLVVIWAFIFQLFVIFRFNPNFAAVWYIPVSSFIGIHAAMFSKLIKTEIFPYEILHTSKIRGILFRIDVIVIVVFVGMVYLLSRLAGLSLASSDVFSTSVGIAFVLIFGFSAIIWVLNGLCSINDFQKARLSFKSTLIGLREIMRMEKAQKVTRTNLALKSALRQKYLRCFEDGLESINKTLYRLSPSQLELVNLEQYYRNVFLVTLAGRQEMELIVQQIELLLDCFQKKFPHSHLQYADLRIVLTTLKNIASFQTEKEYPIQKLNDMVRMTSFGDRAQTFLGSQYVIALVGFLPLLDIALRVFHII